MIKIRKLSNTGIPDFFNLLEEIIDSFKSYPESSRNEYKKAWCANNIEIRLRNSDYLFIEAFLQKRPVALLIGKFVARKKFSYIVWYGVKKYYRNMGIGKKLISEWSDWAKVRGSGRLVVSTSNKQLISYYENLGFDFYKTKIEIGKVKKYNLEKRIIS